MVREVPPDRRAAGPKLFSYARHSPPLDCMRRRWPTAWPNLSPDRHPESLPSSATAPSGKHLRPPLDPRPTGGFGADPAATSCHRGQRESRRSAGGGGRAVGRRFRTSRHPESPNSSPQRLTALGLFKRASGTPSRHSYRAKRDPQREQSGLLRATPEMVGPERPSMQRSQVLAWHSSCAGGSPHAAVLDWATTGYGICSVSFSE